MVELDLNTVQERLQIVYTVPGMYPGIRTINPQNHVAKYRKDVFMEFLPEYLWKNFVDKSSGEPTTKYIEEDGKCFIDVYFGNGEFCRRISIDTQPEPEGTDKWNTSKVKIIKCDNPNSWYAPYVGQTFTVYGNTASPFGYADVKVKFFLTFMGSNFERIKDIDCELIPNSEKRRTHNDEDVERFPN